MESRLVRIIVPVFALAWVASLPAGAVQLARSAVIGVCGMHCETCARSVQHGLMSVPGVKAAKVDLKPGIASVTLDESNSAISNVVLAVDDIPDAMGALSHYSGRLVVRLRPIDPSLKLMARGNAFEQAQRSVQGIRGVKDAHLKGSTLTISFASGKGDVTLDQIDHTLGRVGVMRVSEEH